MGRDREWRHDVSLLRDEDGRPVAKDDAMIVDCIIMIDRPEQLRVAPVDRTGIACRQIPQRFPVHQGFEGSLFHHWD